MNNVLSVFYDEFPSDLEQPKAIKKIFFGTLIWHENINENLFVNDENNFKKYLDDPGLRSVSVFIEKTNIIKEFLKNKFGSYKSINTNKTTTYNTCNFVWASVLSICFSYLYMLFREKPPDFNVFFDPKSLKNDFKQEIITYLQKELVNQISVITNKNIPLSNINIKEGRKEMIGIKIADAKARKNFNSYPEIHKHNITEGIEAILKNFLEKGCFFDSYEAIK